MTLESNGFICVTFGLCGLAWEDIAQFLRRFAGKDTICVFDHIPGAAGQ